MYRRPSASSQNEVSPEDHLKRGEGNDTLTAGFPAGDELIPESPARIGGYHVRLRG